MGAGVIPFCVKDRHLAENNNGLQNIVQAIFYRISISCYISAHARNYYQAL